jgi:HSP20 family protein
MWNNRYHRNLLNAEWPNDLSNDMETASRHCLQPRADLERNANDFRLYVELPGVSRDDVQVEVEDGVLKISGEKKNHAADNLEEISRERCFGKFSRAFRLGREIDSDNIRVEFNDGLLQVLLPRTSENQKRSITIN